METAIEPTQDPESVSQTQVRKEDLSTKESKESQVPIRFKVRATGAQLRHAGKGEFADSITSDELTCSLQNGTRPFQVDLLARQSGRVSLELSLIVKGAVTLRDQFELQAISDTGSDRSPAPPPAPAGSASSSLSIDRDSRDSLATESTANVRLEVRKSEDQFLIDVEIMSQAEPRIAAALTADELSHKAIELRNELIKLSEAYKTDPANLNAPLAGLRISEPKDALLRFAQIGGEMHEVFFGHPEDGGVSDDLKRIARLIAEMGRGPASPPPRMQIDAEFLPFPWAIMYDGSMLGHPVPQENKDVDLYSFWGVRFKIDRLMRGRIRSLAKRCLSKGSVARVQFCINPHLDREQGVCVVGNQRQFFESMRTAEADQLRWAAQAGGIIESRGDFEQYIKNEETDPCDLLYLFCHADAAVTVTQLFLPARKSPEMQASIRLDENGPGAEISIKEMRRLRRKPLSGRPLVFLNACSSAQGDRAFQSQLLEHFRGTWEACGFIGTDWKTPTTFADAFARLVLGRFLSEAKPSIADAFWSASKETLEQLGNPFPLIFALYVHPNLTA